MFEGFMKRTKKYQAFRERFGSWTKILDEYKESINSKGNKLPIMEVSYIVENCNEHNLRRTEKKITKKITEKDIFDYIYRTYHSAFDRCNSMKDLYERTIFNRESLAKNQHCALRYALCDALKNVNKRHDFYHNIPEDFYIIPNEAAKLCEQLDKVILKNSNFWNYIYKKDIDFAIFLRPLFAKITSQGLHGLSKSMKNNL